METTHLFFDDVLLRSKGCSIFGKMYKSVKNCEKDVYWSNWSHVGS